MPTVLVVCSANRVRSVMGEAFLRRELAGSWEVSSAGFSASGEPPLDEVVSVMRTDYGIDVSGLRSRQLSPMLIETVDVILTMERRHAAQIRMLVPEAAERVHTVNGFAYGSESDINPNAPAAEIESAMSAAAARLRG